MRPDFDAIARRWEDLPLWLVRDEDGDIDTYVRAAAIGDAERAAIDAGCEDFTVEPEEETQEDRDLRAAARDDLNALFAYARALEQERDAAQARHDAEIAGIVVAVDHEAFMLPDAGDRLIRLRDSIATTHATALARHAGRTGGSNG